MKSAKKPGAPVVETSWENPLIPNRRLRELYTAMVELRLLGQHTRRRNYASGEEACRVSTALSMLPGDLSSSEAPTGYATAFLRGAKLDALSSTAEQLPSAKAPAHTLHVAIGAALGLVSRRRGQLVVAYVAADALTLAEWKPILRLAAANATPILIVILAPANATKNAGQLSLVSDACGVPGIPVDFADVVALYRVVQESMLRIRAGGGPVLMECVHFQIAGKKSIAADPIFTMRESLVRRKLADDKWFNLVESRFMARLEAAAL